MNKIKTSFNIRDLENITGIKSHTLRIWEKRYKIVVPERTETNIRTYSLGNLQKLLNVSFLNKFGYKISKIANLTENEIIELVNQLSAKEKYSINNINTFKLSMLNFDENLFNSTYNYLKENKSFNDIFENTFIPFLEQIGYLWQTDSISISHEHFITSLIKQKLLLATEEISYNTEINQNDVFILFLPENEVHELGILYLNFILKQNLKKVIFLGQSVPVRALRDLKKHYNSIKFITTFTICPEKGFLKDFITEFENDILIDKEVQLLIYGRIIDNEELTNNCNQIKFYKNINQIIEEV